MWRHWLALSVVLAACGGGSDDDLSGSSGSSGQNQGGAGQGQGGSAGLSGSGGSASVCTPGKSEACTGPGACQGGQVCKDDGSGFGPCDCGTAGTGGAAGGAGSTAGGTSSGTGGSSAGNSSSGAGGSSCTPLTPEQACASNQCGVASDGCGGEVKCSTCGGWQTCEIQQGQKVCIDICPKYEFTDDTPDCAQLGKQYKDYPVTVGCTPTTINDVTHGENPGCLYYVQVKNPGSVDTWVACCKN